ncbi:MAG: radical SAM protein [Clostridiales bacterium]|nr:radical SAM protein [Clostridiales bacterium]
MTEARVCALCPRRCRARRLPLTGAGVCGMGYLPMVARAAPHFDEEPCISGSRGSGAVFFSGCALGCVYCQNSPIRAGGAGRALTAPQLRAVFDRLAEKGVHNLNLVTASHFVDAVAHALEPRFPLPVVYNSGGYESIEALRLLEGKVQIYLPDFKYPDEAGGRRYAAAPDYPAVARAALVEMARQVGPVVLDKDGVAASGLIVRHLVLPGRTAQAIEVLNFIAGELPKGTYVSLMAQYLPVNCGDYPEIDRRIYRREYDRVVDRMLQLGLDDGYVQGLSAAQARYIPPFDLTGVGD